MFGKLSTSDAYTLVSCQFTEMIFNSLDLKDDNKTSSIKRYVMVVSGRQDINPLTGNSYRF